MGTKRKYTPVVLLRLAVLALVIAMDHVVLAKFAMSICLPLIPTLQFIHMELSKQHIRSATSIERQDLKRSHNPSSREDRTKTSPRKETKSGTIETEPPRLRPNLEGSNLKIFCVEQGSGTFWFVSNGRISREICRETVEIWLDWFFNGQLSKGSKPRMSQKVQKWPLGLSLSVSALSSIPPGIQTLNKLFEWLFSRVLAYHVPGSIPGRDMSDLGPLD